MKLVDSVVKSFAVAKTYHMTGRITSFGFSPNGDAMISGGDDGQINYYNCTEGIHSKVISSTKYGVELILFAHSKSLVLHSSTKSDDNIRYLDIDNNKYIRYFSGHTKKVVTLCICPKEDLFISSSLDNTLRLWDVRSPNCQGLMHLSEPPVAAFDPEGLIFAVGLNSEIVKLYDLRYYEKGPFVTFKIPVEEEEGFKWNRLKFSFDGKSILATSTGSRIQLIDAFNGTVLQNFTGFLNDQQSSIEASFSPDSQYVFSGSTDGKVHVWNADTGYKICVLNNSNNKQSSVVQCVKFNPGFMMLASGGKSMIMWLPTIQQEPEVSSSTVV